MRNLKMAIGVAVIMQRLIRAHHRQGPSYAMDLAGAVVLGLLCAYAVQVTKGVQEKL